MKSDHRQWLILGGLLGILAIIGIMLAIACQPSRSPTIVLASPANGAQVLTGTNVIVQSTATDAKGIVRVELAVDHFVVRTDQADTPQKSFTVAQTWQATLGAHTLSVRAFNVDNVASDLATVMVVAAPAPAPTPGGTVAPTVAPTSLPQPGACTNNAVMISDLDMPDGTVLAPNQSFNKVWRLLNNGTCAWSAGYQLAFVAGEAMMPGTAVAVPPTTQGATADVKLAMTAPANPGPHVGMWQMRDAKGVLFGQLLDLRINVSNPQPTPVCAGKPQLSTFTASATKITPSSRITLNWGAVSNAENVRIEPGIGSITTPGQLTIVVDQTTIFTLIATCGGNTTSTQVVVTVVPPTPIPTAPPTFAVTGVSVGANPANYSGNCPAIFNLNGTVTTNAAGTLTYRWVFPGGLAPSPLLTFSAPAAGTFALPNYQASVGLKGNLWAQAQIATPNSFASNQALFANNCADPTAIPPTPIPPTAIPPTPIPPTSVPPTAVPRVNIGGDWQASGYLLNLQEAIGCMNYPCGVSGTWTDIRGTPQDGQVVNGSFNGTSLTFDVMWNRVGATLLKFNGKVNGDASAITGTWQEGNESGQVTFTR